MSGGFDALGLMPELLHAISDLGWLLPTDIQDEAIPLILGGGDVMAAAETGSGKTAAFCLPILQCVHERLRSLLYDEQSDARAKIKKIEVTMNENDRDLILQLSNANLQCSTNSGSAWAGARATHGVNASKYFYEATVRSKGITRLGWSTMAAHLELGKDVHGFGYGGKGFLSNNGSFDPYGGEYTEGDVIGCYIDFDNKAISYSKNGKYLGKAFDIPENICGSVLFPAVLLQNSAVSLNFGATPFRYAPITGFSAINSARPNHIFDTNAKESYSSSGKRKPMAIIIEPTRDLAEQVAQCISDLTRYVRDPEIQTLLLIGDDGGKQKNERRLEQGVDIVVGTLGKIQAMIKNHSLDLSQIRFFVLDEADKLTGPDNIASVMQIFSHCPGGGTGQNRLQVCFFSATLHSPQITEMAGKICVNPTWVDLKGVDSVPETVHHVVYRIDPVRDQKFREGSKFPPVTDEVHLPNEVRESKKHETSQRMKELKQYVLLRLIEKYQMSQCLVFCRTNLDCTNLETFFNYYGGGKKFEGDKERGKENPFSCCVLAGMRSMEERRKNLQAFKDGETRILICTDVASRGIDIEGLPYVINMTLPDEAEDYIHRVGRVGRADRMGLAISIVAGEAMAEKVWYHTCSNRGKSCTNRKLKDEGGCTIWYDEPMCLAKIEKRLNQRIAHLGAGLELPPEIASLSVTYGSESKAEDTTINVHLLQLSASVRELAEMELQAQNIFLNLNML